MATIDLGKIKLVWRGTYSGGTAYTVDDVVQHTDGGVTSSFICTTNSTGNAPSTGGSVHGSWAYLAKGHADTVSTTLTTQGDILYRDGSGLQRLAKGTAGQTLTMNTAANAPEWGSGFDGTYKLHFVDRYSYTGSTVTHGSVSAGDADNQRDCIVLTSQYLTITPAHADDYFRFEAMVNYYIPSNNAYGGLGFMTSTATNFSANRNFFFRSGQHSMGNGSGSGDEYNAEWIHWAGKCSEIGLSAGTTYYVRTIGQKHSTNNSLHFCGGQGNGNDRRHYMQVQHWKKQT